VASQPRTSAREERRVEIRRLLIASISSAAAAVIVSQFWVKGTWLAAAMTPVFVILIQEALHRPVDVVADRFTSNRTAVMPDSAEILPEGTGAGAPPPARRRTRQTVPHSPPTRARAEPGSGRGDAAPPVRVYRTGAGGGSSKPRTRKRKLAIGTIAVTALLAFAISAFAITGTELITGGSIGKSTHRTTLFGGGSSNTSTTENQNQNTTQQQPQNQQTTPSQGQNQQTTPSQQNQKTTPGSSSGGTPTTQQAPQTTTP
jgi:hypothetical protein